MDATEQALGNASSRNPGESGGVQAFTIGNLGRHSLVYGIGIVLTKAVSFLMLPIYTRLLTPSDYGVLQLITMFLEALTIFAGARIAFGIFHFYHKAEDEEARRGVLSTALLLLATTYGCVSLGAIALAPGIAEIVFGGGGRHVLHIRLAAASMAFEALILVPTALIQLRNHSKLFVLISMARLVLQVVLNLILLIPFSMGVSGVLLASLIANLLVGGTLAVRMLREVGIQFRWAAAHEFLRFGLPLVAMQVATFVFTFGDRYFLQRAAGEGAVGIYGLAYQFGFLLVAIGFMPFQRVWDPQRFAVAKHPDRDIIYAKVFIYLNVVLVSTALGISLFSGDVLRIIATAPFQSAAALVPLIVAAYVFHCWANFLNLGIFITEKTEYFTAANWAAAAVAVAGYLLLIPHWFAWGAALTTFASLGVRFWLAYAFSQWLWPVHYEWRPVVRITGLAACVAVAAAIAPQISLPLSVAGHVGLYAVYTTVVWRFILLDGDRAVIRQHIRRLLPIKAERKTS